jgi:sensor c-di-GMP phosphodiesterase-like protein
MEDEVYGFSAGPWIHAQERVTQLFMSELRRAIMQDRLLLHYQPKVSLATGGVCGVEALLRTAASH